MELVLLDIVRAIWALRRDRGFVVLALSVLVLVLGGTAFYWVWENLSVLDALYLSVMTLTTVGYGDVKPVTAAGKIFTVLFVIMGIGILLAFLAAIATELQKRSLLHRPLARFAARGDGLPPEPLQPEAGDYDVLVIGSDDASRETALAAARLGLRVVVAQEGRVHATSHSGSFASPVPPA
jgi:hypothetical protein